MARDLPAQDGKCVDSAPPLATRDREALGRLRGTNLNLLPILAAVLSTGSISKAARELSLTQPAVSQALRQLRVIFDDELLVMAGRVPLITERGQQILPPLRQLLGQTDSLLALTKPFDPEHEALNAKIVTADHICAMLTPELLALCQPYSARHRIEFVGSDIKRLQDLAQLDLVILPRPLAHRLGKAYHSLPLFEDRLVCIAARDNPLPQRLSPAEVKALPQLRFSLEEHLPISTHHLLMPAADLENSSAWTFESFIALSIAVAQSERIAIVPQTLARWSSRFADLRLIDIDGENRTQAIDAVWSNEVDAKRGHVWLREITAQASLRMTETLQATGHVRAPETSE